MSLLQKVLEQWWLPELHLKSNSKPLYLLWQELTHLIHPVNSVPRMNLNHTQCINFGPQNLRYLLARHHLKRRQNLILLLAKFLQRLLFAHDVTSTKRSRAIWGPLDLHHNTKEGNDVPDKRYVKKNCKYNLAKYLTASDAQLSRPIINPHLSLITTLSECSTSKYQLLKYILYLSTLAFNVSLLLYFYYLSNYISIFS